MARSFSIPTEVLQGLDRVVVRTPAVMEPQHGFGLAERITAFKQYTKVMLSYGYWQPRFAGDPSVVGRTLIVDTLPKEIVGVMPRGFRIVNAETDLIFPLCFDRERTTLAPFIYQGVARLRRAARCDRRRDGSRTRVRRLARVTGDWAGESSTAERNRIGRARARIHDGALSVVGSAVRIDSRAEVQGPATLGRAEQHRPYC